MILLKSAEEIDLMRAAGRVVASTLKTVSKEIAPGVTPRHLNDLAHQLIKDAGGEPSFLNYRGYPAATCIGVNEVVVHGIPGDVPLEEGDLCTLDFGVMLNGYHADSAWTFPVGKITQDNQRLLDVTRESLYKGIAKATVGNRIGDISATVQQYVEKKGYGIVRDLVGHGIGKTLHEEPGVPNFGKPRQGPVIREGLTICIEPMVNAGTWKVKQLSDGWTIVTADGKNAAHFEHTIAITREGAEILTQE